MLRLATILIFFSTALLCASKPPSYQEVSRKLDELYRSSSAVGTMELTSKTETQTRHLKMRVWSKGQDRTLIIIDEPAREAGTATLKVQKNIWNYLPKISKTIRLPASMMLSSWMGTDFTNDDLVKDTLYEQDFDVGPGAESVEPQGWRYVMTVKPDIVGRWQQIDWVVDRVDLLPIVAKYYDRKGRLSRVMKFSEVKVLGGKKIPTRVTLESIDQPGHLTEIRYIEMRFGVTIDDSKFSLSELERK